MLLHPLVLPNHFHLFLGTLLQVWAFECARMYTIFMMALGSIEAFDLGRYVIVSNFAGFEGEPAIINFVEVGVIQTDWSVKLGS